MNAGAIRAASLVVVCGAWLPAAADGQETFVETFDGGNAEGQWQFMTTGGATYVAGDGGNPGAYLTHQQSSWPAPVVRTIHPGSIFTGDYRAMGVTSLGLDLKLFLAQAPQHPDYTMSIMLVHDNGTPGDISDDTRVWFNLGEPVLWPGADWTSYDFEIPSQLDPPAGELPPGWHYYDDGFGGVYDNHTWREVMENVSQVWFLGINDPAAIGFFWNWISGADNMRITYAASIPGDLNGDGAVGGADLGILLSEWGLCDDCDNCPADLTGDCAVNGADLGVLLSNWTG